jgi:LysM repeat protein/succinate dehydrogenase flavin-adding protein (antitoxin of CptAB toxin-antitoxin module)
MISVQNHPRQLNGNNLQLSMKRISFLLFFTFILNGIFAQVDVKKSTETELYNGKLYYIHTVEQGQTVYSIARAYDVTTDEVFEVNAFAREGIKTEQLLRIPMKGDVPVVVTGQPQEKISVPDDTVYLLTYIADEDVLVSQVLRSFSIPRSQFSLYNPQFANTEIIRLNDMLKLPLTTVTILSEYLKQKPKSQFIILVRHSVKKRETLFSIGRIYGCSVSELQQFNPGISEDIQTEQAIWVPAKEQFRPADISIPEPTPDCIEIKENKHYNVALLIPFYLERTGAIIIHSDPKKNANRSFRSFDYIQFYEGFMLALENISFNNATITLNVYDVSEGEEKINTLISRGLLDVDLIIGPFLRKPLVKLTDWAKSKEVKIVDLYLSDDMGFTIENQNLLSAVPSVDEQLKGVLAYIQNFDKDKNVILVYNNNAQETTLMEKIKTLNGHHTDYPIHYLPYSAEGMNGLVRSLKKDQHNIVISFTNNEVFLNNFTRSLFDNTEGYIITLFGLPSWLRFESIDMRYFNHFNTHFFSSQFVDYSRENVRLFVSGFQDKYKTDPGRLAFLGHDIATYFLGILTHYGSDFPYCTHLHNEELLSTGFVFEKQGENGQFQNVYVAIYEMIEFQLFYARRGPGKNE